MLGDLKCMNQQCYNADITFPTASSIIAIIIQLLCSVLTDVQNH